MPEKKPDKHQAFMHYCEAWKASPRVAALSLEAYKGFFEILNSIWLAECLLTDDDATLLGASRLTLRQWKKAEPELFGGRRPLLSREDGYVRNNRMYAEWERTQDLRERYTEASKKANAAKKRKRTGTGSEIIRNPKRVQTETETETTEEFPDGHSSGASDGFFADEGYREFAEFYRPLKDHGLHGRAPMEAYSALVDSPNAALIHARIMEGVGRMALSGRARQYMPTAENFLKNKHYLDAWEPEEAVVAGGPRSAEQMMKEMGI